MTENNMPAVEAEDVEVDASKQNSYELAFHVLPTIAEGEVGEVVDAIKSYIKDADGEIFDEETPERFELAYEIVKYLEGKNRKFKSAYFGWVRFKVAPEAIATITEAVDINTSVLRHLLIKLTKMEEETPFRFHEAIREQDKMVTNIDEEVVEVSGSKKEDENKEEETKSEEEGTPDTEESSDDSKV